MHPTGFIARGFSMTSNVSPIRRVVLYKHGVGHFERECQVSGDAILNLTFKQSEVSDVLKSLTVLDEDGGHIASVSYDSTKPLEQLLAEVAIDIPDQGSLVSLLPQVKGARVRLHTGVSDPVEGIILGIDSSERALGEGVVKVTLISILTELGEVRSFDLHQLAGLQILDVVLRRDLDYYLKTQLSSKKKDSRTFTFFAQGEGERKIRLSYTLEAPVWKATYRILLGEEGQGPMIQGWAVVDNTQDEDWEDVRLSLVSGLPVSFRHDLYTPRYIRRPEVEVQETTGVLPPEMEYGMSLMEPEALAAMAPAAAALVPARSLARAEPSAKMRRKLEVSSTKPQVRERKVGDFFEYEIEHPVTIRRNQSALVPIVLRGFEGQPILLYNKTSRADNPLRCVDFKNTTSLTLEGGPVTVIDAGDYVGEAMLETMKPDEKRLVPYAVELSVHVLDNVTNRNQNVHKIVVRKGTLTALSYQVQQTVYQFDNKAGLEYLLVLEHPRPANWDLFETPSAEEVTESFWRFRISLAASKTTSFAVKQKCVVQNSFGLGDLGDDQVHFWIDQKYLDEKMEKRLRDVLALQREAAGLQVAVQDLDAERAKIHQEQLRIRENLQALGDRPSEKDLRERFVRTLNVQEDRLELIDRDIKVKSLERDGCRGRVDAALAALEFEKDIE
jgi:hypothetical protein